MAGDRAVIHCCAFVAALSERGYQSAAGVPCSTFTGPIAHLTADDLYEQAANEGLALTSAVGSALGGRRRAIFLQNSGFGNLLNPLVSLAMPYELPVLAFMSLRGWPDATHDEPQHAVMGKSSAGLLDTLGVWHATLDGSGEQLLAILELAAQQISTGRSAFVLVPRGSIGQHPGGGHGTPETDLPDSAQIASVVSGFVSEQDVIVSTTGNLSRHLFAQSDRPANFYMQGSMGHAASIGLGVCAARPDVTTVVLDGDGAALMHLGVLSTIGAASPPRLLHIIVDNGGYESTGAQAATSKHTDLAAIAVASGYRSALTVESAAGLAARLRQLRGIDGPHCVVVRARSAESGPPPRASASLSLPEIAARARRTMSRVGVVS